MRVKLLYSSICNVEHDDWNSQIASGIRESEWEEIDDDNYWDLQKAVDCANRNNKKEMVIIVRYPTKKENLNTILIASEYLKAQKQEKIKTEKREKEYREKKELEKKKRDLKKLEKLKQQYESAKANGKIN